MAVYVDNMRARYGRLIMCHMGADTEAELHAMADKIGVARKWHQGDHYDVCLSKRKLAVAAGAKEISTFEMARIVRGAQMMLHPGMLPFYDTDRARRLAAWAAHYQAKGCSEHKSWLVAQRKIARSGTWPPGHERRQRNG